MIHHKPIRYIIPLRQHSLDKGLTVVMAFMVAIAVLFTAGAVVVSDFIHTWSKGLENSISISVLYTDDMDAQTQQTITDKISDILTATQGIEAVYIISDADKQDMLSHWLGDGIDKNNIDLPIFWDITVTDNFDVSALATAIEDIYNDAVIDDYMHWKSNLLQYASDAVIFAYVVSLLVACVLMVLVSLCVRALVTLHIHTIQVLTLLGASDDFILHDVGRYGFWMGFKSAVFGILICALVFGFLMVLYADISLTPWFNVRMDTIYQTLLTNMLRIIGLCGIIPAVAILSRWGAIRSAKKCIRQQYCI